MELDWGGVWGKRVGNKFELKWLVGYLGYFYRFLF